MTVIMISGEDLYQTRNITLTSHHQSPIPFVVDVKRTCEQIEYKHTEKIWIAQPGSGLDKRQCTLQIVALVEGEQPRIAIIFMVKVLKV